MEHSLKTRDQISDEFKWHLEDIFPDDEAWEKEYKVIEGALSRAEEFAGHLGESSQMLAGCFQWMDEIGVKLENVYAYARMRKDEDNRKAAYQAKSDQANMLAVKMSSATSFVVPELLSMPEDVLNRFRQENEMLKGYDHAFDDILRKKEHVLSLVEEKLLAEMGEIAEAPSTIFSMANNADLKFPCIRDAFGHDVELTKGNYIKYMESPDRRVRQEAFQTLYNTYGKQINTWAATLNANVKADVFYAKTRRYPSAIEASLDDDKVPVSVYDALINTVHEFLPHMYRYVELRKKALNLDELHMYDIYVPIVPETEMKINYEEGKSMVMEGLKPLGEEYLGILADGFNKGWVDVYENEGKTSGAYSWGTYSTHPYVLLNHQDTLDSMLTLAHEMGHSLHSYYSNHHQPHHYAGYKIFVAEVASTLNEALVMHHLMKTTKDKKLKAYLVNHYLEQFRGTIFRQTMFAEFERIIHAEVEKGNSLTAEELNQKYRELNIKYYGPEVAMDPEIDMEWARIPHFYSAFYVYKYATGFSAAIALSQQILEEGEAAVKRYLQFLSGGSSDYPINLLRQAGVDMEKPEPVREALSVFSSLIDELAELLDIKL